MNDSLGDFAFVEGVTPLLGNQPQSFCHIGVSKLRTQLRHLAPGKKHAPRLICFLQLGLVRNPVVMDDFWNGVTMLGILNSRSKQVFPGQPSEALVRLAPALDRAGNSNAMNAVTGHGSYSMPGKKLDGQLAWGPAA